MVNHVSKCVYTLSYQPNCMRLRNLVNCIVIPNQNFGKNLDWHSTALAIPCVIARTEILRQLPVRMATKRLMNNYLTDV